MKAMKKAMNALARVFGETIESIENSVRFIHVRDFMIDWKHAMVVPATHGGKTIAYRVLDDTIEYAEAVCSRSDNFCRAVGRQIATGRLYHGKDVKVWQGTDTRAFTEYMYGESDE